jgi:transcription initiation factor TFIID TATA-box-binding protein
MAEKQNEYKIQNVVFSGNITVDDSIDIVRLQHDLNDIAYKRENFPALIIKKGDGNGGGNNTMLLYRSGSFVATGNKTIDDGKKFITKMIEIFKLHGIKVKNVTQSVVNIVSTGSFQSEIDLDKFILTMINAQYEPEVFPGIIYKNDGATFLIFKAGKFVCVGLNTEKKVEMAITSIKDLISSKKIYLKA